MTIDRAQYLLGFYQTKYKIRISQGYNFHSIYLEYKDLFFRNDISLQYFTQMTDNDFGRHIQHLVNCFEADSRMKELIFNEQMNEVINS